MRYVGTLGGNVANGDPGNDMPAVMLCLGATYQVVGKGGERRIPAREFYQGAYVTALEPGEILTAVRIPVPAGRARLAPTRSSSARSATTPPPPPPWC